MVFVILTIRASVEESFVPGDQALNLGIIGVYSVDIRGPMGRTERICSRFRAAEASVE